MGPGGEEGLQLFQDRRAVEVARDGDEDVPRVDRPPLEGDEVVPGDRLDGSLRRVPVRPEAVPPGEEAPLARLDGGRVVVPPLHLGEKLALAERDALVGEARLGQHLAEDREPFVEVLREEVQRHGPAVAPAGRGAPHGTAHFAPCRAELRGEEREPLLQLLRRPSLRSAPGEEIARDLGEPLLSGRVEIRPAAEDEGEVDEGKLVVLGEVDDDAGRKDGAVVLRGGGRERHLRVDEPVGMRRDLAGGECQGKKESEKGDLHGGIPHRGISPFIARGGAARVPSFRLTKSSARLFAVR